MREKLKIGISAAIVVILMAALYVFYTFNPETQSFFPRCPFLVVTGYECPGCGSQRAIHSLLHFKIWAALKYNVLMVILLPYVFLGAYLQYFGGKKRNPRLEKFFFGRWSALILLLIIVAYWVLRNIV